MAGRSLLIYLLPVLFQVCRSANFIVPPSSVLQNKVVYACATQQVTIPWDYALNPGERIEDIQWHYDDSPSQFVAIFADNHFVALPAFTGRVEKFGGAGLLLKNVRVADTGNYSVQISIHSASGSFILLRDHVFVQVGDSLMTQDGYLHVTQTSTAVKNPNTGSWAIELLCGTFTYRSNPPFNMEWTTPSSTKASTSNTYTYFRLLVDDPVEGGNYACRIPAHELTAACLHANQSDRATATLYVDKVLARLSILEAENAELSRNCSCHP